MPWSRSSKQLARNCARFTPTQTKERPVAIQVFGEAEEPWSKQLEAVSADAGKSLCAGQVYAVYALGRGRQGGHRLADAAGCTAAAAEHCQQLQLALQQASAAAKDAQVAPGRESSRTPRRKRGPDQRVVSSSDEKEEGLEEPPSAINVDQPPQ